MNELTKEKRQFEDNFMEDMETRLLEMNTNLKEYAKNLNFTPVCEFNIANCNATIPWERLNCSGLYFIEIKNSTAHTTFKEWITEFRMLWEDEAYKKKFVPNLQKNRIKMHPELNDYIPLYIGKSKKIKDRVHEHIFKDIKKTTFTLKLKARENIQNETFRLSFLKVDTKNYDWVVSVFEKTLREKLNPITGR